MCNVALQLNFWIPFYWFHVLSYIMSWHISDCYNFTSWGHDIGTWQVTTWWQRLPPSPLLVLGSGCGDGRWWEQKRWDGRAREEETREPDWSPERWLLIALQRPHCPPGCQPRLSPHSEAMADWTPSAAWVWQSSLGLPSWESGEMTWPRSSPPCLKCVVKIWVCTVIPLSSTHSHFSVQSSLEVGMTTFPGHPAGSLRDSPVGHQNTPELFGPKT